MLLWEQLAQLDSSRTPALPQVNFNEPLSMLQRLTEDLEYHHLLDKAVHCTSSVEQMCLVAAFSVSSYSTTVHRIAKPFNPMLGETFELDRLEDMGLRSLCEQVRPHTPPGLGSEATKGTQPLIRACPSPRSCQAGVQLGSWVSCLRAGSGEVNWKVDTEALGGEEHLPLSALSTARRRHPDILRCRLCHHPHFTA